MAPTPTKTTSKRRVRFQTFSSQMKEVSVTQLPLGSHTRDLDGLQSASYSKLEYWNELNLTRGFNELLRSIRGIGRTLPVVQKFPIRPPVRAY